MGILHAYSEWFGDTQLYQIPTIAPYKPKGIGMVVGQYIDNDHFNDPLAIQCPEYMNNNYLHSVTFIVSCMLMFKNNGEHVL